MSRSLFGILASSLIAFAPTVTFAENIAPVGTAITGVHNSEATLNLIGFPWAHVPDSADGLAPNLNDGDLANRVDTWGGTGNTGGAAQTHAYVGIMWDAARTDAVVELELWGVTFLDGGWFGINAATPGPGGALVDGVHISSETVPTVQVTTDGGLNWSDVASTSDYLSVLTGHVIGAPGSNPTFTAPIDFTLDSPVTAIDGIRVVGTIGGSAGAQSNGFLSAAELLVEGVPPGDLDDDGMGDLWEEFYMVDDPDADEEPDGLTNLEEFQRSTDPNDSDTDGDTLIDGTDEVDNYGTDPALADTDGDGLDDGEEINQYITDPNKPDTDDDGSSDALEVARGTDPTDGSDFPFNVAPEGSGIAGIFAAGDDLTTPGTPHAHVNPPSVLNNGIRGVGAGVVIDTHAGAALPVQTHAYVGISWDALTRTDSTERLTLSLATFTDGGWFGINGASPVAGGELLLGTNLSAETTPGVQVTRDRGVTWIDVGSSSTYLAVMEGHTIGGGANPNPVAPGDILITLDSPATGINGLRVLGPVGGNAGTSANGFLAASELIIDTAPLEDSDADGLGDAWEAVFGIDDPSADEEPDGLTNLEEFQHQTNPTVADSDGDSLADGAEVHEHGSDPILADSDGDGLGDGVEVIEFMTDPAKSDSDNDGYTDDFEIRFGTDPTDPNDAPENIAMSGSAIVGIQLPTGDLNTLGTPYTHASVGGTGAQPVNDGIIDLENRVDTWGNQATTGFMDAQSHAYVGITWDEPVNEPVKEIGLSLRTFGDGGWFGVNRVINNPLVVGTSITAETVPIVQITNDGGVTWTDVSATSDYLTVMAGHPLTGVAPPTSSFTLDSSVSGIDGIRLIGTVGGAAGALTDGSGNGFLGISEFSVLLDPDGAAGFRITDFVFEPAPAGVFEDGGKITLTWASTPGRSYGIFYSTDLLDFSREIDDFISASPGEMTTESFDIPSDVVGAREVFFRVLLNP